MTWIQTKTGNAFDFYPVRIASSSIEIEDILSALPKLCRFTGHTNQFYSVAEHSVLASKIPGLSLYEQWCLLLHDAHEAYVGDVSSPLKSLLPDFREIEKEVQKKTYNFFAVEYSDKVKEVDLRMLMTEKECVLPRMSAKTPSWDPYIVDNFPPYSSDEVKIEYWEPIEAEYHFRRRFEELRNSMLRMCILKLGAYGWGYVKYPEKETP